MASTAKERISLMDQALFNDEANRDLLNQVIRLKLADGIKFKTVEDYLIDNYNDNIEFDAEKLKPLLIERANQTKKNYTEGLTQLINEKFNDPKFSEQQPMFIDENGKIATWSFVDVLKDKPIGAIDLENGTLKHGPKTISVEELYNVFMNNNVLNVELAVQNMVSDAIEELSEKNSYDEEAIYKNSKLTSMLFDDLVRSIIESGAPLTHMEISSKVGDILSKNVQKDDNKTEVEKMEQTISTPVDGVDEIQIDNFGVTTKNTEQLNRDEVNALAIGLSYSEQKKIDQIRNSGPEDDEEVIEAGDGVEEETVYLNKIDPSQINDGELQQVVGRAK